MMISSTPKLPPLQIIRHLKQLSTIRIWETHEQLLKKHFYRERTFWTDGYFVASVGNIRQETVRQYIENQG